MKENIIMVLKLIGIIASIIAFVELLFAFLWWCDSIGIQM